MKVLSLLQPWATLCVLGFKKIETRSFRSKYEGPLLIHASSGKQCKKLPDDDPLFKYYYNLFAFENLKPINELPYGAIIGQVTKNRTVRFQKEDPKNRVRYYINELGSGIWEMTEIERAFGYYTPGRYGWLLSDPVQFATPTPAKGQLGLWEFNENLLNK